MAISFLSSSSEKKGSKLGLHGRLSFSSILRVNAYQCGDFPQTLRGGFYSLVQDSWPCLIWLWGLNLLEYGLVWIKFKVLQLSTLVSPSLKYIFVVLTDLANFVFDALWQSFNIGVNAYSCFHSTKLMTDVKISRPVIPNYIKQS